MEPLERVRAALRAVGVEGELRLMSEHLPTAPAAAEALGVELGRLAKSILLMAGEQPILVVTAGREGWPFAGPVFLWNPFCMGSVKGLGFRLRQTL